VSAVAGIVLGDRLSIGAFLGVALAITAITLISQDGAQEATAGRGLGTEQGLAAALSAGVLIGVFFAALKQSSPTSGLLPLFRRGWLRSWSSVPSPSGGGRGCASEATRCG